MTEFSLRPYHEYPPMMGALEDVPEASPEWAERLGGRLKLCVESVERNGIRHLEPLIRMALDSTPRPWYIWPKDAPCRTPDEYFRYAAHTNCDDLAKLITAYKGEDYSLVRDLRAATAEAEAKIARENQQGGRGGTLLPYDVRKQKVDDAGNSTSYLLRRLSRKNPEVFEAYQRGQFPTPTAAARAAGIVRDKTPEQIVQSAWKKASPEQRETIAAWVDEQMSPLRRSAFRHTGT